MGPKRMALLAGTALALIAFAVPATASASGTWTSGGKPLKEGAFVNVTGVFGFDMGVFGKFECEIHAKMVMTAGEEGTGHLEKIELTTKTCEGEGALGECELIEDVFTKKSWMLTATEKDIDLASAFTDFKFEGCFLKEFAGSFGNLTLDPDNPTAIRHLTITPDEEAAVEAFGTLEIVGEGAGAYGVH